MYNLIILILTITIFNLDAEKMVKYVQIQDVSLSDSEVKKSKKKGNLFEIWYLIDNIKGTVTRTYVRRLDKSTGIQDNTVYKIIKIANLIPESEPLSLDSNLELVIIAVGAPGSGNIETLWMGTKTMYTCRNSGMFHYVTSGIYERM